MRRKQFTGKVSKLKRMLCFSTNKKKRILRLNCLIRSWRTNPTAIIRKTSATIYHQAKRLPFKKGRSAMKRSKAASKNFLPGLYKLMFRSWATISFANNGTMQFSCLFSLLSQPRPKPASSFPCVALLPCTIQPLRAQSLNGCFSVLLL